MRVLPGSAKLTALTANFLRSVAMARDEEAIAQTFRNYVASFQRLKPDGVVSYCDAPCLFISAQGVRMLADAQEVAAFIAELMESLQARGFYAVK
jgi:hypothetical protein